MSDVSYTFVSNDALVQRVQTNADQAVQNLRQAIADEHTLLLHFNRDILSRDKTINALRSALKEKGEETYLCLDCNEIAFALPGKRAPLVCACGTCYKHNSEDCRCHDVQQ